MENKANVEQKREVNLREGVIKWASGLTVVTVFHDQGLHEKPLTAGGVDSHV